MVTREHEAPIELFNRFPQLLPSLLSHLGLSVPDDVGVTFVSERCTEMQPSELIADGLALLESGGNPRVAVILESQRGLPADKRLTWAKYAVHTCDKYRVPVILLVYCPREKDAKRCAQPIIIGPGSQISVYVVSPHTLPPLTSGLDQYRDRVDLAVIAALLHSGGQRADETLNALQELLDSIEKKQAAQYAGTLIEILPQDWRETWKVMMAKGTYEYEDAFTQMKAMGRTEGKAEGKAEGELRGKAKMLLLVLEQRGIEVSDEDRATILNCQDDRQLNRWIDKQLTIDHTEELFD